jgi:putative flippase GtrA
LSTETIKQLIRYIIAGVFNTCIGLTLVYLLKDHIGIEWANIVSSAIGLFTNFITTKLFTFKTKGGNTAKQGSSFFIVYATGFTLMFSTLKFLLWQKTIINNLSTFAHNISPQFIEELITTKRFMSITSPEMIATYFGVVVFSSINFSLNKFITFKK